MTSSKQDESSFCVWVIISCVLCFALVNTYSSNQEETTLTEILDVPRWYRFDVLFGRGCCKTQTADYADCRLRRLQTTQTADYADCRLRRLQTTQTADCRLRNGDLQTTEWGLWRFRRSKTCAHSYKHTFTC